MSAALGIVSFENESINVEGLMEHRPVPAISFLGRYRLIDFVVSNMTNSGIQNLKIFVKKQPRSLIEQLGDGRHYNINSKHGRLQILYEEQAGLAGLYNNDINAYLQNMEFIENAEEEYVVISPGYMVYSLDFNDVLKTHKESGADVTIVYKNVDDANEHFINCATIGMDANSRVNQISPNIGQYKTRNVSMDTYILSKKLFIDLVYEAHRISPLYSFKDMLRNVITPLNVKGYQYRGYLACINSLKAYYDASMDLIDYNKAKNLFKDTWTIHTKTNDSPPAFYGADAEVSHCLIANGCQIEGKLTNCVLGRGVVVQKGCNIKNSILLPEAYFSENCNIDYAVIDKWVRVVTVKEIQGKPNAIAYVHRHDQI